MKADGYYQSFYLNDSLIHFNSMNYFCIIPVVGKKYSINACNPANINISVTQKGNGFGFIFKGSIKIKAKPAMGAIFIGLYKDHLIPKDKPNDRETSLISKCGNKTLSYEAGRLLLEILKPQN
jgi:hypothetical protein